MEQKEIVSYITQQMAAGFSEVQIKEQLKSKGCADSDIETAFSTWKAGAPSSETKAVGSFVKESWNIYQDMFHTFVYLFLKMLRKMSVVLIPMIILWAVGHYNKDLELATTIISLILGIYLIYLWLWMQIAFVLAVAKRHTVTNTDEIINEAQPLIRPYFWTSFLSGILVFLGFILLIIPGIIYGLYYSFSQYVVIDKHLKGMAALRLSKKYVEGYWWPTFRSLINLVGVYLLIYILNAVVVGLTGDTAGAIFSSAVNILVAPYSVIYMFLVYEKLKSIKPEIQAV